MCEHPSELNNLDLRTLEHFNGITHFISGHCKSQSNSRGASLECFHFSIDDTSQVSFTDTCTGLKTPARQRLTCSCTRLLKQTWG